MAKTKAFTKFIGPPQITEEDNSVNQSSPTWVLTFIRWDIRDTLRVLKDSPSNTELLRVRDPLVVENDCVQVSVSENKSILTHSFNAVLLETDVNYATAIAPGDFVLINMLNWEKDARRIARIASDNTGNINKVNDGFKGIFKVQGVRKTVSVDPASGVKRVFIKINGFAFTEFNNIIYYNPYFLRENAGTDKDQLTFPSTNLGTAYSSLISPDKNAHCQDLIKALINAFVGVGVSDRGETQKNGVPITGNTHFYIPPQVGKLLGLPAAKAAKDIYTYIFGIQTYSSSQNIKNLSVGLNPSNLSSQDGRFYYTTDPCPGNTLLKAEYWNQVNAWSILNQYTNAPINELFSSFKVSPEGLVLPTITFRQMPFTTDTFGSGIFDSDAKVTRFLNLPRWKISPSLIYNIDIGREETARINFVQYYSQPPSDIGKPDAYISAQTAGKNFVYDINDVIRSGLHPYVISSTFQDIRIDAPAKYSRQWAQLIGDAVMGGHLKLNGTIECVGIVDPISVGDNLEYEGVVFHIEELTHVCSVDFNTGSKTFKTLLKLSNGVSIEGESSALSYPEMEHPRGYSNRVDNFENKNKILPGISEEQDVRYREDRTDGAPTIKEIAKKDSPFAQPGKVIKPLKKDDNNEQS